jgi:hypothetical protein
MHWSYPFHWNEDLMELDQIIDSKVSCIFSYCIKYYIRCSSLIFSRTSWNLFLKFNLIIEFFVIKGPNLLFTPFLNPLLSFILEFLRFLWFKFLWYIRYRGHLSNLQETILTKILIPQISKNPYLMKVFLTSYSSG